MHSRTTVPAQLRRLAAAQSDVVTARQLEDGGVSRTMAARLVGSGQWQRMAQGVYLTVPVAATWDALAWAGVLLGGPEARLGAQASGYFHGLRPVGPTPVDVLLPHHRRVRVAGPWTFLRERPGVRTPRSTGFPPRLPAAATVLDLAAASREPDVVDLITTAVQRNVVSAERLLTALEASSRHPHRRLITKLVADVIGGAESPLEIDYLREVERPHGLPIGNRQHCRDGLPYRTDVGYDDFALLVELDGRAGHEGSGRFRDMFRDNQFAVARRLTLRYGWFDVVNRPCSVAWQVATVLRQQGWSDGMRRCRRCWQASEADLRVPA